MTNELRLDQRVAQEFNLSRSQAAKMIRSGNVYVNGKKVTKPALKVSEKDQVVLQERKAVSCERGAASSTSIDIPVLYEDNTCIVVNKPAGLIVHPAQSTSGEPTLIDKFPKNYQLVHRLDKETTGCLLIAKNEKAHAELQKQFKDRTVRKTYLAIVEGIPKERQARIEAPIGRSLVNRVKMSLFRTGKSRDAVTTYEVINEGDGIALLECDIETGRTHQIRVHLSSIGHPILGDAKYGKTGGPMMLHAWKIAFRSPENGETINVIAPKPATFSL